MRKKSKIIMLLALILSFKTFASGTNGVVDDKSLGIMWEKCSLGLSGNNCDIGKVILLTWSDGLAAAAESTRHGYSDWRLPTKIELQSLINKANKPAINKIQFPFTAKYGYWTSLQHETRKTHAWIVHFNGGYERYFRKNSHFNVRLVRDSK